MAVPTTGILARVDLGKPNFTERIPFATGAPALVRLNGRTLTRIDSHGRPDLVAEVERSLCVRFVVPAQTYRHAVAVRAAVRPLIPFGKKADRRGIDAAPRSVPCTVFGH